MAGREGWQVVLDLAADYHAAHGGCAPIPTATHSAVQRAVHSLARARKLATGTERYRTTDGDKYLLVCARPDQVGPEEHRPVPRPPSGLPPGSVLQAGILRTLREQHGVGVPAPYREALTHQLTAHLEDHSPYAYNAIRRALFALERQRKVRLTYEATQTRSLIATVTLLA
jgi:hypothetical protein